MYGGCGTMSWWVWLYKYGGWDTKYGGWGSISMVGGAV